MCKYVDAKRPWYDKERDVYLTLQERVEIMHASGFNADGGPDYKASWMRVCSLTLAALKGKGANKKQLRDAEKLLATAVEDLLRKPESIDEN